MGSDKGKRTKKVPPIQCIGGNARIVEYEHPLTLQKTKAIHNHI